MSVTVFKVKSYKTCHVYIFSRVPEDVSQSPLIMHGKSQITLSKFHYRHCVKIVQKCRSLGITEKYSICHNLKLLVNAREFHSQHSLV